MWNTAQIKQHSQTAKKLGKIKDAVGIFISQEPKITEYDVQQYILSLFEQENIVLDAEVPIVAFGANTAHIHYFPTKKNQKNYEKIR